MNPHFDAWKHPILEHFELLNYYKGDGKSMAVVRGFMPHRIVCEPSIEIEIDPLDLGMIRVSRVWPGGAERISYNGCARTIEALRRLYRSRRGAWRVLEVNGHIRFTRKGCAHRASGSKSGWVY
jgi:hypothetical protein